MTRRLMILAAFALTGCGGVTPDKSTEVEVTGTVTGKYTYSFQELQGKAAAFNAIPADYKRGSQDRVVEVEAGKPLDIKVQ